jgi:hypothetical protein
MKTLISVLSLLVFVPLAAEAAVLPCPSEDAEPALEMKTAAGPSLEICGFEDHEVKAPKGTRVFSDFKIFFTADKTPAELWKSDEGDSYFVRVNGERGLEVEELWFFTEKPTAVTRREVTCTADACAVSEPKCIYKAKAKAYPKALANFNKKLKENKLKDDGEELLDQIFAQALGGDKDSKAFYEKAPAGLTPDLIDVFESNKKDLSLSCPK